MTITKRSSRSKAEAPASDFYMVELSDRFPRRGTTYLPGRPIRVTAALYAEMKEAGVIANGQPV